MGAGASSPEIETLKKEFAAVKAAIQTNTALKAAYEKSLAEQAAKNEIPVTSTSVAGTRNGTVGTSTGPAAASTVVAGTGTAAGTGVTGPAAGTGTGTVKGGNPKKISPKNKKKELSKELDNNQAGGGRRKQVKNKSKKRSNKK